MMSKDEPIRPGERIDDLQRGGLRILSDPAGFCFGVDAVLLAHFARARRNERVLDLCTGNGIVPILMSNLTKANELVGVDMDARAVDLFSRSVQMNGLDGRLRAVHADIREIREHFGSGDFDAVTANPPYHADGSGPLPLGAQEARFERSCTIGDICGAASWLLKFGGRLFMVHKPHRLADIFSAMREHEIEPKTLRLVHSYVHKPPILVLIEGIKRGAAFLNVMPPLVLYSQPGVYTDEARRIYWEEN